MSGIEPKITQYTNNKQKNIAHSQKKRQTKLTPRISKDFKAVMKIMFKNVEQIFILSKKTVNFRLIEKLNGNFRTEKYNKLH